jgi:hypothetical protein
MGSEDKDPHIEITLSTNNDTVIRAVLIFAEGVSLLKTNCVNIRPFP